MSGSPIRGRSDRISAKRCFSAGLSICSSGAISASIALFCPSNGEGCGSVNRRSRQITLGPADLMRSRSRANTCRDQGQRPISAMLRSSISTTTIGTGGACGGRSRKRKSSISSSRRSGSPELLAIKNAASRTKATVRASSVPQMLVSGLTVGAWPRRIDLSFPGPSGRPACATRQC
jgi:hypothetical protein